MTTRTERAEARSALRTVRLLDGGTVEAQVWSEAPNARTLSVKGGATYLWARPVEPIGREFCGALLVAEPKADKGGDLVETLVPTAWRVEHRAQRDGTVEVATTDLQPGDVIVAAIGTPDLVGAVVAEIGTVRALSYSPWNPPRDLVKVTFEGGASALRYPGAPHRVIRPAA